MQFIKNGPDVPDSLLQTHEDGKVVFFCGAGVSYPAGLPGFKGLVDKLYNCLGESPSPLEQTAIAREQFDTAIGLLEGRVVGGRQMVRKHLPHILNPDLSALEATKTHQSLMTLGKNREGRYRLITTNFDRIFENVIQNNSLRTQVFKAPLLPVPKRRWDGLVYLHGFLPQNPLPGELDSLVISSGDFGLAYLSERWAARFVSELFRNYIVCFVGYSITDPVLRYMMDALAADRLLGESPSGVYAFGGYPRGDLERFANEWKAKNVTPVMYEEDEEHTLLHQTLRAWGDDYRDGVLSKERLIAQYAASKPMASTAEDDSISRVLWALSDKSGLPAKRFADLDPAPPLDWLDPLTEKRFRIEDLSRFGVESANVSNDSLEFSLLSRPTPPGLASPMSLVSNGQSIGDLDTVMSQIARWLTRHIDNPKLILWVAKQGGVLHPKFAWLLESAIKGKPPTQSLQTLWQLAVIGRLQSHALHFDFLSWHEHFAREPFNPALRIRLCDMLTPYVRLSEPLRGWEDKSQQSGQPQPRVKDLVQWEIILGAHHVHMGLNELGKDERWLGGLPGLLTDATRLLRDALDLMRELDGANQEYDISYMHMPSIEPHSQNRGYYEWTALIDLTRDAWLTTAQRSPSQAKLEVERWCDIRYPIFRRLVLFAATDLTLFSPSEALRFLLADNNVWLWSSHTKREAMRLLTSLADKLELPDRALLDNAILKGPPREHYRADIEPDVLQQLLDHDIWLRLAKCRASGAHLSANAAERFEAISRQFPAWEIAEDESDEFTFWMGDFTKRQAGLATPRRRRDLVEWLRTYSKRDAWREDDWRERCKLDLPTTTCALYTLARSNEWPTERWREALQAWSDEDVAPRSWRCTSRILSSAPDLVIKDLGHTISWWLLPVGKGFTGEDSDFFVLVQRIIELCREEVLVSSDEPVFKAMNHPIGQVVDAALRWWYRQSLRDGMGLHDKLKHLLTQLCDTDIAIYRHGRVVLATHVIALFRVDPNWTISNFLPLLDWDRSGSEASAAWQGFLHSPQLYRPFIELVKPHFLKLAIHYNELGEIRQNSAALLTYCALELTDIFREPELKNAIGALPPDGLEEVARALIRALEDSGLQRNEYWHNRVLPFMRSIWPKSRKVVTPTISELHGRLCIAVNENFPEALAELRPWLQLVQQPDFLVHQLHESKLCTRFPNETLDFLDLVIRDKPRRAPLYLKECLEGIQESRPDLVADERFRRLSEYLRSHS